MSSGRRIVCGSAFVCGALLVACADAFGPTISAVDGLFADLDDTWSSSTNPVSVSPGITHLTTRPAAAACGYDSATQRFVCPSRTQNGLTSSTSYQLLDAADVPQTGFGASTATVRVITDVSGLLPSSGSSTVTTLSAHADEMLSGLASGTRTLNGTATSTFSTGAGATASTYSMVETTSKLVLAARASANPYPPSGSITTQIFSGPPGGALISTVTSTFNGTQKVTLVITTGLVTQTCTIDLTGAVGIVCT